MKKIFLTMIVGIGFGLVSNAQNTDKGNLIIGGNVSFDSYEVKDANISSQEYAIMPNVGYFIQDNFAVGLRVGYAASESKNAGVKTTFDGFAAAPYARLYAGSGEVKFFGQLSVPMEWGTSKIAGSESDIATYGAAISPGIAYFLSDKVGLEVSVKGLYYEYNSEEPKGGAEEESNRFGLNANSLRPTIGVNFYF